MSFFLKRAKKLLPYINKGEENMGVAEAKKTKKEQKGGKPSPPLRKHYGEQLA
jgi:hypothetical protein